MSGLQGAAVNWRQHSSRGGIQASNGKVAAGVSGSGGGVVGLLWWEVSTLCTGGGQAGWVMLRWRA